MNIEHDDQDQLSEAGKARRDRMLPIMQDAMRNATRQRRQRRSVAGSLVLLLAAFIGWELLDIGTNPKPARQELLVDSSNTAAPSEVEPSSMEPMVASSESDTKRWYETYDPIDVYQRSGLKDIVLTRGSTGDLPESWSIDRGSIQDIPIITSNELLGALADANISAAIICDETMCRLRIASNLPDTGDKPMSKAPPLRAPRLHKTVLLRPNRIERIPDSKGNPVLH